MENDKLKAETANEREERILKFWQEDKTFEKSLAKDSPAGEFVFYDGPPFATGLPHYGHLLPTTIKDVIPRYKTMKGYHVERRWGWDCHGLPIENLVEGELGLKTKKDIETLGIDKFNEAARNSVLRYEKDWKRIIPRVGRWVDMENDYKTMDWKYTESIWWIFKTLFNKNLIYEGYKSMHLCPRCETTLANFEVNQGYKDITDLSLIAKFELIDEPSTFVLAWTTTPWTLPGNVALAVNPEVIYCKIKIADKYFILAKERLAVVKEAYEIIEEFVGTKLLGKKYKPLYDYYAKDESLKNRENGWKIYGAEFVTTTDGTGVVHIAPAFGEDDMNLGNKEKLPFVQHVGTNGRMRKEVTDFADLQVKPKENNQSTDVEIIKNLAHRGLLFSKEKIVHSYPHCWRCDTPLLNYASSSWFVKVTEFKSRLIANNQKTNWVPENLRDGRFGNWLDGARDWAISRARYWGAPLPVWRCSECKKIEVMGSIEDLRKHSKANNKYLIMRHGQSVSNVLGSISCEPTGNELTEEGQAQAKAGAESLQGEKIDLIVASDFTRAKQTAEITAEVIGYDKSKIIYDDRLHEVNFGAYNNESIESYHSHFKSQLERFNVRPEGGENLSDVKQRVASFLYSLEERYKGKKILIVSHGDPTWLMQTVAQGIDPKDLVSDITKNYKELFYLKNAEVRKLDFSPLPHNKDFDFDFHKPYIDEVVFDCSCGGKYKRVTDVFDCWFESGSMPYAQVHYPFENKEKFEANFPADFIAEGVDQTRGWFYLLMVLSTALFDEPTFKNVIVNGLILAEDGQKMSKRLKNYPDLMYVVEKYGADALRYYIISSSAVRAEDLKFSEKGVDEIYKKLILRLNNVVTFYETYAGESSESAVGSNNILDIWVKARLSSLAEDVEKHLKDYELDRASRPIMDFVDDLSTWYLRRSRDRFKSEDMSDRNSAFATTRYVLEGLSKIIAPFIPFTAEDVYQRVTGDKTSSVHLQAWPFFGEVVDDETESKEKLFAEMKKVRDVVSIALDERKKLGLPVRQPLKMLKIKSDNLKNREDLLRLIKDEVNVKEVVVDTEIGGEVWLDTNITPELKDEGNFRDLTRHLQDMRKKMGLQPEQKVTLVFSGGEIEKKFINKFSTDLQRIVGVSSIQESGNDGLEIKIGEMTLKINLSL
jgi:isoleucyl-tRNA synthetase